MTLFIKQRADFAIADLTVTDFRKEYVLFTDPFMTTGLAILIHKNHSQGINSFANLADQTVVKYGVLSTGSTHLMFNQSTDPLISRMYQQMTQTPDVFVDSLKEGIRRVKSTPFAMIVEQSSAEFITGRDCDLVFIEDQANYYPRDFALALPKNSPHLAKFNLAINAMKTSGKMQEIFNRYYRRCDLLKGVTFLVSLAFN